MTLDAAELTARLVQCASVTPKDDGAIPLLETLLTDAGFACARADSSGISNLIARWGDKGHPKTFGFNGHTDVVPVGDLAAWSVDPFGATVVDGVMIGRGTTDMKSGVAAFVSAAVDFVNETPPEGAILITVTGDEEGEADHGTRAILDRMALSGEAMSVCLVGEPTCPEIFGDMIKIGRRGSMNVAVQATGVQGHAAYPHRAKNPVSALARLVDRLSSHVLDQGTEHFDPSTLALTSIDTGNAATNVIPAICRAQFNIRFNDAHTSDALLAWIDAEAGAVTSETGVTFSVSSRVSGESFITPPGDLSALVAGAVQAETGVTPALSTTGGTSDARFIRAHCPVVEFGLVGKTMHQVDESVEVAQIHALKSVYKRILSEYFS